MIHSTVFSISTSSNTMADDLPPNSNLTPILVSAIGIAPRPRCAPSRLRDSLHLLSSSAHDLDTGGPTASESQFIDTGVIDDCIASDVAFAGHNVHNTSR